MSFCFLFLPIVACLLLGSVGLALAEQRRERERQQAEARHRPARWSDPPSAGGHVGTLGYATPADADTRRGSRAPQFGRHPPPQWLVLLAWAVAGYPLVVAAVCWATVAVARGRLGEWPTPGRDDPKWMDLSPFGAWVDPVVCGCMPLQLVVPIAAAIVMAYGRPSRSFSWAVLVFGLTTAACLALDLHFGFGSWWMD